VIRLEPVGVHYNMDTLRCVQFGWSEQKFLGSAISSLRSDL